MIGNLTIDDVVRANGTTSLRSLGGNTIHASTAANIWGVTVGIVARVGEDFPAAALTRLRRAGIDTAGVHPVPGPTLRFWILYGDDGERTFVARVPGRGVEVAPDTSEVPSGWLSQTLSAGRPRRVDASASRVARRRARPLVLALCHDRVRPAWGLVRRPSGRPWRSTAGEHLRAEQGGTAAPAWLRRLRTRLCRADRRGRARGGRP